MNEAGTWRALRQLVGTRWHATRVEDRLQSGIPDVTWGARGVQGWLELKYLHHWPVRGGPADLGLRPQQAAWLQLRHAAGLGCWVLIRVARVWYLFRGDQARWLLVPRTCGEVITHCHAFWDPLDPDDFIATLTRGGRSV